MKELSKTSFLTNILYYIKLYSGVLLLLTALNLPFIILIIIAYSSIHYVKINKGFEPNVIYAIDIVSWSLIIFAVLGIIKRVFKIGNSKMEL